MRTVTALLTNKAYGYPRRGARRRRKPTILACLHQTANAKATAIQERNYDRITVAGRSIVSVRLTPSAYAHGFALALPEKVAVARPTGVGRAISTYTIPIEGRDEWLAAARRLA